MREQLRDVVRPPVHLPEPRAQKLPRCVQHHYGNPTRIQLSKVSMARAAEERRLALMSSDIDSQAQSP
jgi:hypothetical protein